MKSLQLAINYGMSVKSLARGLGCHVLIASEIILRHQQTYSPYWAWRAEMLDRAMLERQITSVYSGWALRLSTSPNKRTLYNFPCQSGGADMLRDAAVRLCDAGIVPLMLVHDGILFEFDNMGQIEHAKEIMRQSGRLVCDGLKIGVDIDQIMQRGVNGDGRFRDGRDVAKEMWKTIMDALHEIGALNAQASVVTWRR
jgi:hypothetical protein